MSRFLGILILGLALSACQQKARPFSGADLSATDANDYIIDGHSGVEEENRLRGSVDIRRNIIVVVDVGEAVAGESHLADWEVRVTPVEPCNKITKAVGELLESSTDKVAMEGDTAVLTAKTGPSHDKMLVTLPMNVDVRIEYEMVNQDGFKYMGSYIAKTTPAQFSTETKLRAGSAFPDRLFFKAHLKYTND